MQVAPNDQGIHHDRSEAEHRYEFGVELSRRKRYIIFEVLIPGIFAWIAVF